MNHTVKFFGTKDAANMNPMVQMWELLPQYFRIVFVATNSVVVGLNLRI